MTLGYYNTNVSLEFVFIKYKQETIDVVNAIHVFSTRK